MQSMGKRFTATEIWEEDWFLAMPKDYKLFWYYMLAKCDHAGLFKVNLRSFCALNEAIVDSDQALIYFNCEKERIRVVNQSIWLVEDFFVYQYGSTLNTQNRVHQSILNLYEKNGIGLTSIRGLNDLKDGVKDKDKDKDKDKEDLNVPFEDFWNLYDKKVGEKGKLQKKWGALKAAERLAAMDHIPKYKIAQPDKTYRKDPSTYINNKSWNDEIIVSKNGTNRADKQSFAGSGKSAGRNEVEDRLAAKLAARGAANSGS